MEKDGNVHFNYDDLITEIYARIIVHDVYLKCLVVHQKLCMKHLVTDSYEAERLHKEFLIILEKEIETAKQDNPVINEFIFRKIKEQLSDIPGIKFSGD